MYAIIRTGGKQCLVSVGDVIEVEKIPHEAGAEVTFDQVLMVGGAEEQEIGRPILEKARVTGEVLEQFRGGKVLTFKQKRRKNYRKVIGHRQCLTRVRIKDISME